MEEQDFSTTSSIPSPAETPEPIREAAAPSAPSFKREYRDNSRVEYVRPSSSGLEPLPGETISKWKQQPAVEQHAETAAPEVAQRFEEAAPAIVPEAQHQQPASYQEHEHEEPEFHATETAHEDHAVEGLSEEEAATLAEHVAEAQNEEAARESQDRVFAEADAAEAEEERELEEEEEAAETEGMIAPPPKLPKRA